MGHIKGMLSNRKGFLSFVLVMVFSSAVMLALYTYSQMYHAQEYSRALLSEKMYYETLDAKHNLGSVVEQGMWVGYIMWVLRTTYCVKDCACDPAVQAGLGVLTGGTSGVITGTVCPLLDSLPFDPCENAMCTVDEDHHAVMNYSVVPDIKPDLKRGVTLMLFADEIARLGDNDYTVVYVCTNDSDDFKGCMSSLSSMRSVLSGNVNFDTVYNAVNIRDCKPFILTGFDFRKLTWTSSCDSNINIKSLSGEGYNKPLLETSPDESTVYSANVTFDKPFGVIVYDKKTGSMSGGYVPVNKEFTFSKVIGSNGDVTWDQVFHEFGNDDNSTVVGRLLSVNDIISLYTK